MVNVKVMSISGCNDTEPTIDLVQQTAEELGIEISFTHEILSSQEEAENHKFIGSPTIQINDLDIDQEMRTSENYGIT